jgi:translation initiation factor 6 (eIF-6)
MLTVDIQNEPNSFVVDAIIKSDTNGINFYEKLQTDDFRIDIADKLFALVNADIIKNDLAALEDPNLSEEERLSINNGIADMETRIGTPIISIDKNIIF